MTYTWQYTNDGARVVFTANLASDQPTYVVIGTVVNGLVAQSLCNHLAEVDPSGALLHTTTTTDGRKSCGRPWVAEIAPCPRCGLPSAEHGTAALTE